MAERERPIVGIMEALPVGVWVADRKDAIVSGNPAARRICGGARYVVPEGYGEYRA